MTGEIFLARFFLGGGNFARTGSQSGVDRSTSN